jgi:hypothetical protein
MKTLIIGVLVFIITGALTLLNGVTRFIDNGNSTITDIGTSLVWQKCSYGQNVIVCSGTAGVLNWQQALQYCRDLTLAGRSWRLPSINELGSIADFSVSGPSINNAFFPNTESSYYWSSSTHVNNADNAWYIFFNVGGASYFSKSTPYYVRCVSDGL